MFLGPVPETGTAHSTVGWVRNLPSSVDALAASSYVTVPRDYGEQQIRERFRRSQRGEASDVWEC